MVAYKLPIKACKSLDKIRALINEMKFGQPFSAVDCINFVALFSVLRAHVVQTERNLLRPERDKESIPYIDPINAPSKGRLVK